MVGYKFATREDWRIRSGQSYWCLGLDMTNWLIGSGPMERLSSPGKATVECLKSLDLFGYGVKDCSATRILSSWSTDRHPRPTNDLVAEGFYPSAQVQSAYSTASPNWASLEYLFFLANNYMASCNYFDFAIIIHCILEWFRCLPLLSYKSFNAGINLPFSK